MTWHRSVCILKIFSTERDCVTGPNNFYSKCCLLQGCNGQVVSIVWHMFNHLCLLVWKSNVLDTIYHRISSWSFSQLPPVVQLYQLPASLPQDRYQTLCWGVFTSMAMTMLVQWAGNSLSSSCESGSLSMSFLHDFWCQSFEHYWPLPTHNNHPIPDIHPYDQSNPSHVFS